MQTKTRVNLQIENTYYACIYWDVRVKLINNKKQNLIFPHHSMDQLQEIKWRRQELMNQILQKTQQTELICSPHILNQFFLQYSLLSHMKSLERRNFIIIQYLELEKGGIIFLAADLQLINPNCGTFCCCYRVWNHC